MLAIVPLLFFPRIFQPIFLLIIKSWWTSCACGDFRNTSSLEKRELENKSDKGKFGKWGDQSEKSKTNAFNASSQQKPTSTNQSLLSLHQEWPEYVVERVYLTSHQNRQKVRETLLGSFTK
jgi:hypothetical protein